MVKLKVRALKLVTDTFYKTIILGIVELNLWALSMKKRTWRKEVPLMTSTLMCVQSTCTDKLTKTCIY